MGFPLCFSHISGYVSLSVCQESIDPGESRSAMEKTLLESENYTYEAEKKYFCVFGPNLINKKENGKDASKLTVMLMFMLMS